MNLKKRSINWALKHVLKEGDTDLFPRPFEFEIIKKHWAEIRPELEATHINGHQWRGPRRLIVPKSDFAFRSVCQLDPLDSILFAATIKEMGGKIEKKRTPIEANKVFSYRFKPTADGRIYGSNTGWEQFWRTSEQHCESHSYVLVTDISDYYNQIYHHTIENQIDLCGISKDYWHAIKNLLANITEGVSRGVPIGPHPSHMLAELAMIPIDQFLESLDLTYCRYVDDINIFCENRDIAHASLYKLVEYLDKTQKIQINKQKTKIYNSEAFKTICTENKIDKPINKLERDLIRVVRSSTNSPYERIRITKVSLTDLDKLSQENIETILREYITAPEIDFIRLRWFLRRLAQVGAPGGIKFILKRFDDFLPAIAEVAQYFEAAAPNFKGKWKEVGGELMEVYDSSVVRASEYLQVVILSLFSKISGINQINHLTKLYPQSTPMCQRKIMLAAAAAKSNAWLSTLKGNYKNTDPWTKRALLYSMRALPSDERDFWLKSARRRLKEKLEIIIADEIR